MRPTAATLERLQLTPDATYLITGGTGALGQQIGRWMVERGARHLVLVARNALERGLPESLRTLEQAGTTLRILAADVSKREELARVLADIIASLPPLRGIVHAAGMIDDGVLMQQSLERFHRAMAPKVSGAWHLHSLTREVPLEFIVLFSSAASVIGSAGQGNYAAANADLDALASHRRGMGLPGLAIDWGPWAEGGMAAALDRRQQRRGARGIAQIAPEQGLRALELLVQRGVARAAVLPVLSTLPGEKVDSTVREMLETLQHNVGG